MATKKKTSKKKAAAKVDESQSFRIVPETKPFLSFKITRQTVYWIILVMVIVALQLWIVKMQLDIANVIDALQAEL